MSSQNTVLADDFDHDESDLSYLHISSIDYANIFTRGSHNVLSFCKLCIQVEWSRLIDDGTVQYIE